jgi:phenol hydroxylase P1 protein
VQIDIKTTVIQPKRQTFDHIAKRLGGDRPASRYEEATMDVQWENTFHYRPLWDPQYKLFDKSRTKIVMADWYALKDPRQYYYANYNIARSRMVEGSDHAFDMVDKRDMLKAIPAAWAAKVTTYLLPLRHYEWGGNMNNGQVSALAWGAALSNATAFHMADRLGNAQVIGRIGLAMNENTEVALDAAKQLWLNDPRWTPIRNVVEDSFVVADPIELFIAQNLAMDGIIHPLVLGSFAREGDRNGASALSFLTAFINDWKDESDKWIDFVVKTMAAESDANKGHLKAWLAKWSARMVEAVGPLAADVLGADAGKAAVAEAKAGLEARAAKLGLA